MKWFLEVEIFAVYRYVHLYVLQIFQSVKLDLFDLSPLVIFFLFSYYVWFQGLFTLYPLQRVQKFQKDMWRFLKER